MLDQGNNFYLISLSILITYSLDDVWLFYREISFKSFLGVKRLKPGEIDAVTNNLRDF